MHVWMRRVFISIRDSLSNLSFLSPEFIEEIFAGSEGNRRLRVDVGEAGLFEGRQQRIAHRVEIAGTPGTQQVIEVTIGVNTILTFSELQLNQGGAKYFIAVGGTPSGTFSNTIPVIPKNTMTGTPSYTSQLSFASGGTISGYTESPIVDVRTSSGNNARATSVGNSTQNRGFGPTTLYIVIEVLDGVNDDVEGILSLEWEERP